MIHVGVHRSILYDRFGCLSQGVTINVVVHCVCYDRSGCSSQYACHARSGCLSLGIIAGVAVPCIPNLLPQQIDKFYVCDRNVPESGGCIMCCKRKAFFFLFEMLV